MKLGVVVVAAGSGVRLGGDGPKALERLHGRSLADHAVAGITAAGLPAPVLVHPAGFGDAFRAAVRAPVSAWVTGGQERRDSVRAGVLALDAGADLDIVVVHDAARPLTPSRVIRDAVAAVATHPGVIAAAPAIAVTDTLKRVDGERVLGTVDRANLVMVQTPQVFQRHALAAALDSGDDDTDELAPVERLSASGRLSGKVVIVEGSAMGGKITYPQDLRLMAALAASDDARYGSDAEPSGG